jgi:hypothetical protein
MVGTYPGTHHTLRMDEQGVKWVRDFSWYVYTPHPFVSCGPFTLKPGESIRLVWTDICGSVGPQLGKQIWSQWKAKTCTWPAWEAGEPNDLAEYYKVFEDYPELAPTANDQAKDRWLSTGKDSLFMNANAAQWAFDNNYDVPIPPPAPSLEVTSMTDKIRVEWGQEAESASDFAGYRVYRAIGESSAPYSVLFECGEGTANPLTNSYDDITAERGRAYFYYVAGFDDGIGNQPDVRDTGESLESGKYLNKTTKAAYLTRAAGSISSVRVVPNPFNANAAELQYPGEPDKIMFMDVPPVCTISIYSQSGDLVKIIEHTTGSGDASWGVLLEEHSTTNSGQIIVSGIYIAHIETPDGEKVNLKFVVVR